MLHLSPATRILNENPDTDIEGLTCSIQYINTNKIGDYYYAKFKQVLVDLLPNKYCQIFHGFCTCT